MAKISSTRIKISMALVPSWQLRWAVIQRTYEFKDFPTAINFVNVVARISEEAWHHPDIDIRGNRVKLALTTHDEGGLTRKDFELAASIDAVFAQKWSEFRHQTKRIVRSRSA